MGAWGSGASENDSARDWISELDTGGAAAIRRVLKRVADTDAEAYLDVDDGSAAVAAAEIVAAALTKQPERLNAQATAWLEANIAVLGDKDADLARRAVERVMAGESELRALWGDSGPHSAWHADVRELLGRLGGGGRPTASQRAPKAKSAKPGRGRAEQDPHLQLKQALLAFLGMRGLEPTDAQYARMEASRDAAEIRRWLARAPDAPSVAALLDE